MKVTSLSTNTEYPCYLLSVADGSINILLDCPLECDLSNGSTTFYAPWCPNNFKNIDLILISNHQNLTALPFILTNAEFAGKVYITEAALELGQILIEDFVLQFSSCEDVCIKKRNSVNETDLEIPTMEHISRRLNYCVHRLHCGQQVHINHDVTITPTHSGYTLGGCNWVIKTSDLKIVYFSASAMHKFRYPAYFDAAPLEDADVWIVGNMVHNVKIIEEDKDGDKSARGTPIPTEPVKSRMMESYDVLMAANHIGSVVINSLKQNKSVLIPVSPVGAVYDLIEILLELLGRSTNIANTIHFISPVAKQSLEMSNVLGEWMSPQRQSRLNLPDYPLAHGRAIERRKVIVHEDLQSVFQYEGPYLVMGGNEILRGDCVSRDLFAKWVFEDLVNGVGKVENKSEDVKMSGDGENHEDEEYATPEIPKSEAHLVGTLIFTDSSKNFSQVLEGFQTDLVDTTPLSDPTPLLNKSQYIPFDLRFSKNEFIQQLTNLSPSTIILPTPLYNQLSDALSESVIPDTTVLPISPFTETDIPYTDQGLALTLSTELISSISATPITPTSFITPIAATIDLEAKRLLPPLHNCWKWPCPALFLFDKFANEIIDAGQNVNVTFDEVAKEKTGNVEDEHKDKDEVEEEEEMVSGTIEYFFPRLACKAMCHFVAPKASVINQPETIHPTNNTSLTGAIDIQYIRSVVFQTSGYNGLSLCRKNLFISDGMLYLNEQAELQQLQIHRTQQTLAASTATGGNTIPHQPINPPAPPIVPKRGGFHGGRGGGGGRGSPTGPGGPPKRGGYAPRGHPGGSGGGGGGRGIGDSNSALRPNTAGSKIAKSSMPARGRGRGGGRGGGGGGGGRGGGGRGGGRGRGR